MVCKGSQLVKEEVPTIHQYMSTRRKDLLEQGVIAESGQQYVFTQDQVFGSPSTAAGVILGRTANGRIEWKTKDGTTLEGTPDGGGWNKRWKMPDVPSKGDSAMPTAEDTFLKSTFYEQLVEHVFISEVLQEVWYSFGKTAEVLRSEVDASGYDVVFECNGFLRHVQLKTSKPDAKTSGQKVNIALAEKPSGCVVWIIRHEDQSSRRMRLSYRFFGESAGQPLRLLESFKWAKHTKANTKGVKNYREAIRVVPKSCFKTIETTAKLVEVLFGLRRVVDGTTLKELQVVVAESEETTDV